MEPISQIVMQLATGIIGGNLVGSLIKSLSLGRIVNNIVGAFGGALGCEALVLLGCRSERGARFGIQYSCWRYSGYIGRVVQKESFGINPVRVNSNSSRYTLG